MIITKSALSASFGLFIISYPERPHIIIVKYLINWSGRDLNLHFFISSSRFSFLGLAPSVPHGSLCVRGLYLPYGRHTFFCRPTLYGRYVTIITTQRGGLGLNEVEVYSARRGKISTTCITFLFSYLVNFYKIRTWVTERCLPHRIDCKLQYFNAADNLASQSYNKLY